MTRHPVTVDPGDCLRKAWLLMRQGRFHHLPVVDAGRVVGIITDRDIWERSPARVMDGDHVDLEYLMDRLRVMGVMNLHPLIVEPTTSIVEATQLLRAHRAGALLIAEGGVLTGIATKDDLLGGLLETVEGGTFGVTTSRSSVPQSFGTAKIG